MPKLSPRLGYYIVSLGTVIQVLGLSGGSWLSNSSGSNSSAGALTFAHPGDVMLVIGMAVTVLGVILGFFSLAESMPNEPGRTPRLLPFLPLVLLVGLSIGSVSFAFQASGNSPNATQAAGAASTAQPTAFVVATPGPGNCPDGTVWHPVMGHCMTPEAIAALQNAKCPEGYALDPNLLTCLPSSAGTSSPGSGTPASTGVTDTHVCPIGFFWHPAMNHCMETSSVVCPAGYAWSTAALSCVATSSGGTVTPAPNETPACPNGTFWHPTMNHCMSNTCPPGFDFDYAYDTCIQVAQPSTPPPTGTPAPIATATPPTVCPPYTVWDAALGQCALAPTPTPPPVGQECPDGYFWHPAMGHCMSYECPPGLVFDQVTLYCVLPGSGTPEPTATPTPTPVGQQCPDGYFWNPNEGHCDTTDCPPGLVWDPAILYCVLPTSPTPTATAIPPPTITPPAPAPTPECPDGYFWHPDMGHCMSYTCPPGLVFDYGTLYCVLPGP